ncbi:MAG: hypothetical protein ACHQ03_07855 [Candidatus Bathyarchaeia archaeon]
MSSESSNEFSDWFNSPDQRSDREKAMLMSGTPLEIKAQRFLTNSGYRVMKLYYTKDLETGRELDFLAEKVAHQYRFTLSEYPYPEESRIYFWIDILGECKRSSTHDFFAFAAEQPERLLEHSIYPIPLYDYKADAPHTFVIGSLSSRFPPLMPHFRFPFIADRIVEVDANNFKTRKGDNYGDEMTHQACEALLSAAVHQKRVHQSLIDIIARQLFATLQPAYLELSKKMPKSTPMEVARRLVEIDSKRVQKQLGMFPIVWGVPLIVLDDNRGLIATSLRKDGSVEFGADLGLVLYPYISENIQHFRKVGARGSFPVIICKNASLADALKIIETGTQSLIQQFTRVLKNRPEEFIEQILATAIEQQESQKSMVRE